VSGTIAVTGADGFVGGHLCATLEHIGRPVARIVRRADGPGPDRRLAGDLASVDALARPLRGVESVVHLAARAHVMRETEPDAPAAYARANVEGTANVAAAAARAGARRLVFVSSIGVNGPETAGRPFTESQAPAPAEPYAASKLEAEARLRDVALGQGLEFAILRPPMVYGAGVKGNLRRLLALAHSGLPLPLASLRNRRSLIGVENLVDLIVLCLDHPAAAGELFLAAEPEVHSTPSLLRAIATALGRPSRLFRCAPAVLAGASRMAGLGQQYRKLAGSLEVCADKARERLGWHPRLSFEDGIRRMASAYLAGRHGAR
jgi:nucleoside-diphosphate-sugar epimerase